MSEELAHRPSPGRVRLACTMLLVLLSACGGGGEEAGDTTPAEAVGAASVDSPASAPGAETTAVQEQASCGISDFAAAAMAAVNRQRAAGATCGSRGSFAAAAPLRWSSPLAVASAAHSTEMAALDYFSHTSADGRGMSDRVDATGYLWASLGENIAAGFAGIDSVVEGWMRSEGHCANIMNPAFDEMGLACVVGTAGSRYSPYWTQNLARRR